MYKGKKRIEDETLIEMIKNGDETAMDYIYTKNYNMIVGMIIKKGGTEDQAKDIFQDSIIVLWQKIISNNLVLKAKLSTYLFSVCRNLWLKEFKRNSKFINEEYAVKRYTHIKDDLNEQSTIMHKTINQLGEKCRKVLTMYYFDGMNLKQICEILGFANVNTTKTKRYKCKKKLDELIKEKYTASDFQD